MFTRTFHCALVQRRLFNFFTGVMDKCFEGQVDRYNGITVDSSTEPCDDATFSKRLEVSLEKWMRDKRRTIWFYVDLSQTFWIPELTKRGFKFHHAKDSLAVLYRWLPSQETCNVPPYAHTNLGVGAVVLNEETNEILVVKEKHLTGNWKLPGGYVEPGEDLTSAVEREVFEETGITAEFNCIVAFRQAHQYIFGCSDIYFITCLVPKTLEVKKCDREISECQWMRLEDFVNHSNVHENNKFMASKVMEYLKHRMGLAANFAIHPTNKKPICVYAMPKIGTS